MQNFLSILDLDPDRIAKLLELAAKLKRERVKGLKAPTALALNGRHVGLLFEKPSLRTRVTFTIGVRELGGDIVEIPADVMHADREPINDVARNLERWVDAVVIRTFGQERLHQITEITPKLHVINALSNEEHPCQALADMQTLYERWGAVAGKRIAFVGDGNNVCTSLVHAAMMLGIHVHVATPKGFELPDEVVDQAAEVSQKSAGLTEFTDPKSAVRDVDAIYTDVWTSMGQEVEYAERKKTFRRYQVTEAMMALARPGALFMHCLPAHRGEEVSDEVIESPISVVFDQAENRLHYLRADLLDDDVDVVAPEALVYEMRANGKLKLVGHEYIVPIDAWTEAEPPMLFDQQFHQHPVLPLYVLHAWVWRHNPDGMFVDWNPKVRDCPAGVPIFGG